MQNVSNKRKIPTYEIEYHEVSSTILVCNQIMSNVPKDIAQMNRMVPNQEVIRSMHTMVTYRVMYEKIFRKLKMTGTIIDNDLPVAMIHLQQVAMLRQEEMLRQQLQQEIIPHHST